MKRKYIIMYVINGASMQKEFSREQKEEAIEAFKRIKARASRSWFYSIDSEDDTIWYDWTQRY